MPNPYYQQTGDRTPVYAEEQPDWQTLIQQSRQAGQTQQEQARRASEQTVGAINKNAEMNAQMLQAPAQGYQAYQAQQDRQLRRQQMAEESAQRVAQTKGMEMQNQLTGTYGAREKEAQIGGTEAQTALAQQGLQKGQMEISQLTKWQEPGSAMKMFGRDPTLAKLISDPSMSAQDFKDQNALKMDTAQRQAVEQQYQQAKESFPLHLKEMSANIAALGQQANIQGYEFGRKKIQDQTADVATMTISEMNKARQKAMATLQNDKRMTPEEKEAHIAQAEEDAKNAVLSQTDSVDPKLRAFVEGEVVSRKAALRLQQALARPTLDPTGYAQQQMQTEDYQKTYRNAEAIRKLILLHKAYKDADGNGILIDTGIAKGLKEQMAAIASSMDAPQIADTILNPTSNFTTVNGAINGFIGSLGSQAKGLAQGEGASQYTKELAREIDRAMMDAKYNSTNSGGYVTKDGLRSISSRGKPAAPLPMQNGQAPVQPAYNNEPVVPNSYGDQIRNEERQQRMLSNQNVNMPPPRKGVRQ